MGESLLLIVGSLLLLIVVIISLRLFNVRRLARKRAASERMLLEAAIEAKRLNEERNKAAEERPLSDSETIVAQPETEASDSEFTAADIGSRKAITATDDSGRPSTVIDCTTAEIPGSAVDQQAVEEAAHREAERRTAEETARRAAEQTARQEALRKASEETARRESERRAVPESERSPSEPTTIEQLAARLRSSEDTLRRQSERLEADRRAIEQAVRSEENERQAVEKAIAEEQKKQALGDAPRRPVASRIKLPEETIVMIADDSRVVRVKTSRLLTANQYRVAAAEDGLDAARQIEASPPDVLVTDVDMPGLNGFQLAKMVRDNPLTANLPIIMVTSDNEQLRAEAARIGVNVVLGKPYPEELLITQIQKLMEQQIDV